MHLLGFDLEITGRGCYILTSICVGLILIRSIKSATYQSSVEMAPGKGKGRAWEPEEEVEVGVVQEVSPSGKLQTSKT